MSGTTLFSAGALAPNQVICTRKNLRASAHRSLIGVFAVLSVLADCLQAVRRQTNFEEESFMRFAFSLKHLSCGLALVSFLSVGAASAQTLAGVNATLDHNLDSKKAAVGQSITAKLDSSVKTTDGIDLPRGTELIGKVAAVTNDQKNTSISLLFTTAKLKDGKEIPIKATVIGAYPSSQAIGDDINSVAPAPDSIAADGTFTQQPGALRHVALTSAVKNENSGTFSSNDGPFRLTAGTFLQVGLARAASGTATRAAE